MVKCRNELWMTFLCEYDVFTMVRFHADWFNACCQEIMVILEADVVNKSINFIQTLSGLKFTSVVNGHVSYTMN